MKRPSFFSLCNAILVAVSTLIGLGALPAPDAASLALAFWAIAFLPGILLYRLLFRDAGVTLEGTATAVCLGLACPVLASAATVFPGIGFEAIAVGLSAAVLLLLFLDHRRPDDRFAEGAELVGSFAAGGSRGGERALRLLLVVFVFAACAVFFYGSGALEVSSDGPDHVSFVRRALETGNPFPFDSFFRGGDGAGLDPRKGLWHGALALWAGQANVDPVALWRFAPAMLAACQLVLFLWFARVVTGSIGLAILAAGLFLLCFRGEGTLWLTKAAFSRNIAQGLLWGAGGSIIAFVRSGNRRRLVSAAVVAAAGCAAHIVFALLIPFMFLGLFLSLLTPRGRAPAAKRLMAATAAVLPAVALPAVLRLLLLPTTGNEIHTHMQGMLLLGGGMTVLDPAELISRMHIVFPFVILGAALLVRVFRPRSRYFLAAALFWPPVILVLFPPTATVLEGALGYLHYRILYAAPVMCMLSIIIAGLVAAIVRGGETGSVWRRIAVRAGAGAGLLILLAVPLRFAMIDTVEAASRITGGGEGTGRGRMIGRLLGAGTEARSVVVSDPKTSYLVSAWTGHFVTVIDGQHGSPADTAAFDRLRETRDLFSPAVPLLSSVPWLREQRTDLLLLDLDPPDDFFGTLHGADTAQILEKFDESGILEKIDRDGGMVLFAVHPLRRPSPADSAAVEPPARGDGCPPDQFRSGRGEAVGEIVLEGICLERELLAPGDTLRGEFLWSTADTVRFGLPIVWHIRLDGPAARGTWHRPWYGKQYRRVIERRAGQLRRLTVSGFVGSTGLRPDRWEIGGAPYREPFEIPLPAALRQGEWTIRVTVRRRPYLLNRIPADYLRNEDSLHGAAIETIRISTATGGEAGE